MNKLHLLVHPIAVRIGHKLLDDGDPAIPLRLISAETFETGVMNLVYGPAQQPDDRAYEDAEKHLPQLGESAS